ncbi:MAG: hypothetical protein CFE39_17190 [Comamonadaceae bacterium PBBC2]|nr:MAG: hypothetical protein CFE39_17190 [Comamonadaceae bacterium PBBC2]
MKNKNIEAHEHLGIFSFDNACKTLMLRQFHIEGFLNTQQQFTAIQGAATLVFESVSFENFSSTHFRRNPR